MKKLISMLMAGAMVLALAVPALATNDAVPAALFGSESTDKMTATTSVKGATQGATIKLYMPTVATTGAIVVNPYKLVVKSNINGSTTPLANGTNEQIIAPTFIIKNESDVPLDVAADVTTTLGGNMKLETASMDATKQNSTKTNSAWIELACKVDASTGTAPTATTVLATGSATHRVTLKAGAVKLAGTTSSPLQLAVPNANEATYLEFTFFGNAATQPTTAWSSKDTVSVAVAWTFTPAVTAA